MKLGTKKDEYWLETFDVGKDTQLELFLSGSEPIITSKVFDLWLEEIINHMKSTLQSKAKDYADLEKDDRMHNFKRAALQRNTTPETALFGMLIKHWVSLLDLLDGIDSGKPCPSKEYVREKLGDLRNYLVLLEVLLHERRVKELGR